MQVGRVLTCMVSYSRDSHTDNYIPLFYFTLHCFTLLFFYVTSLYFTLLYFTLLYFTLLCFTLLYFVKQSRKASLNGCLWYHIYHTVTTFMHSHGHIFVNLSQR